MEVSGILLAAGGSARMEGGYPKLTLPFKQRPLLWWSLKAALFSKLKSVILIVGAHHTKVLYGIKNIGGGKKFDLAVNKDWQKGRSTSVLRGLELLPESATHVMFLQGDQPLMTVDLIDSLVNLCEENPKAPMIFPIFDGNKANPVIFSDEGLVELKKIKDDRSGFDLTKKFGDRIVSFALDDNKTQFNVNTNSEYRKLIESYEVSG